MALHRIDAEIRGRIYVCSRHRRQSEGGLQRGGVHIQAERIDYQTSLAPLYFLASVETTVPALRGTASRLGIQDCR
jgi:hypothetical protein